MKRKRHFHSFDALRFLAFFKVFLFHLPIAGFPIFSYLKAGGGIGVMFFFVLSGFLISYIILEEKERTGSLNLKHFLIRRILRIWPLYYLMILFAFLTPFILAVLGLGSSDTGYEPNWWYSISFLENYRMIFLNDHPNVSPLGVMWSLCIEEHFYLLWGFLFYFLGKKQMPMVIIGSVIVAQISRYFFSLQGWDSLDLFSNLDLFAVGAIPAYLLMKKEALGLDLMRKNKHLKGAIFLLTLIAVVFSYPHLEERWIFIIGPLVLGLFFMGLLLLFIADPVFWKIGDKNLMSRWGKYTYGLYVYHTIVIALLLQLWERWGLELDDLFGGIGFGLICFAMSLVISILSYRIFERPFLKLKRYFY